jgi:hypothetical protein
MAQQAKADVHVPPKLVFEKYDDELAAVVCCQKDEPLKIIVSFEIQMLAPHEMRTFTVATELTARYIEWFYSAAATAGSSNFFKYDT